jgi:hypothetical protein
MGATSREVGEGFGNQDFLGWEGILSHVLIVRFGDERCIHEP